MYPDTYSGSIEAASTTIRLIHTGGEWRMRRSIVSAYEPFKVSIPFSPCGRRWPHSPSKDGRSSNALWGPDEGLARKRRLRDAPGRLAARPLTPDPSPTRGEGSMSALILVVDDEPDV